MLLLNFFGIYGFLECFNFSKVQARMAFSAYLSRVQQRLMMESESHVQEVAETAGKQEEQMVAKKIYFIIIL